MQQLYRRRLLALGPLEDAASADSRSRSFIRFVLNGPVETRPDSLGVRDVLLSMGVPVESTNRFVEAFDDAVWGNVEPRDGI